MNRVFFLLGFLFVTITGCKTIDVSGTLDAGFIVETNIADTKLAKRSFDDEILNVKGYISEYSKNSKGQIVLKLAENDKSEPLKCVLKKNQTFEQPFRKSQYVELKGYALYSESGIELLNCIVLKVK